MARGHAIRVGGRAPARRKAAARKASRRRLRVLAILLVSVAVGTGGWLWVRESSLVQVRDVAFEGLSASNSPEVRRALRAEALGMTTLNPDPAALERAAAEFPNVQSVSVETDFPNGMTIEVVEREPVARLVAGQEAGVLSADGRVLSGLRISGTDLPTIAVDRKPQEPIISGPRIRAVLRVLGAAPRRLLRTVESASWGPRGVTLLTAAGTRLYFGSPEDAATKWASVARVSSDRDLAEIRSIDVRVSTRPAVVGALTPEAQQRADERRPAEEAQPETSTPPTTGEATGGQPPASTSGGGLAAPQP